jgi:hypothetical protein
MACSTAHSEPPAVDLKRKHARNRIAYIPPQCFTRVQDAPGAPAQNPCYVCHAEAPAPNPWSQPELQLSYDFPETVAGRAAENPWRNLFRDRRLELAAISDSDVDRYVQGDNYRASGRGNALAQKLGEPLPPGWDGDGNGRWDGYVPDAWFRFDAAGFDRAPDGTRSGWRSFAYYPMPGAFLPTNGSFDDVMIRLAPAFRQDAAGREDVAVYVINLAIIEALIGRRSIAIDPVDERPLGVDLDGDGTLGSARRVAFRWKPRDPASMSYVGRAAALQRAGRVHLAPGLFPEQTEFLHSVRYLTVARGGRVVPAPRMKELRYARKHHWLTYSDLSDRAQREAKEAVLDPDRPELFLGDAERGLHTGMGWSYQGFIEDARGELRPQSHEETLYCMGCHGGLSATDDGIFTFSRKLGAGPARGWSAQAVTVPARLGDPLRADGQPEYATYLRQNRAGDEFRANDEVLAKFFDANGVARRPAFARLASDIASLLLPSAERARALDKASWLLTREQSFTEGRDPLLRPADNVLPSVSSGSPTGISQPAPAPRLFSPELVAR